jgi:putative transposase
MRTIKRESLHLNTEKMKDFVEMCSSYGRERKDWLKKLERRELQALLDNPKKIRDTYVEKGYTSHHGLQARHWKLALEDACDTWTSYWEALFVKLKPKIVKAKMTDKERHYAYWLIKGFSQFSAIMQKKKLELSGKSAKEFAELSDAARQKVHNFIRKNVNKLREKSPTVKKYRVVKFDADCYSVFEHNGKQYVELMSLQPRKRIAVPLKGKTKIEGTITLVLGKENVFIHVSQELEEHDLSKKEKIVAVDFGYTEVMTDNDGERYGTKFGEILTQTSDALNEKTKRRNKIHAIEKKERKRNPKKAKRIRKNNLGRKKLDNTHRKAEASINREVNTAINELIEKKKPDIIVTENLSHVFKFDKSKKINRRLSSWQRGTIQKRVEFKALAEGFCHEQVSAAYSSQLCPRCGYVDNKNRSGDRFCCQHCKYESMADRVAAMNLLERYGDPEILEYMPYAKVETILSNRFRRRLEEGNPLTVADRTLDIVGGRHTTSSVAEAIAGRGNSL